MMRPGTAGITLLAALVAALSAAACGSGAGPPAAVGGPAATATTATTAPPVTGAVPVGRSGKVTLVAEQVAWSPAAIRMTAGQRVTIVIANRDAIEHDFTVAGLGLRRVVRGERRATVSFVAPPPGTYHFVCTLHPLMKGDIAVL